MHHAPTHPGRPQRTRTASSGTSWWLPPARGWWRTCTRCV